MIECTMINNATGEIMNDSFKMDEFSDMQRRKDSAIKSKLDNEFKALQQEYLGSFVFFLFSDIGTLASILNDNDLVKFIYLGTYVKSDGALRLDNNKTCITKDMLKALLGVSINNAKDFYKTMREKNLITQNKDGELRINPLYFFRGKDRDYKKLTGEKLKEFARLYTKSTRALYEETNSRNFKGLAMTYKLLPFTNWKFNVLCENINETNEESIKPLNLYKVCELLGWNKKNMKKLLLDLMATKVQGYNVFLRVGHEWDIMTDNIIVNPLVYYRASEPTELSRLISLFKIVK